jgi:endonuclease YncB( thermonuclease family)
MSKNQNPCELKLEDCTYDNTEKFTFAGKTVRAKCVKVYDGDTITVVFETMGVFYRFSIRMNGYDSPEIRSKNPEEKKYGKWSRDYLSAFVLNKIITLECKDYDKYGRVLADVYVGDFNINEDMVTNGYSRIYDGGKRMPWDFSKF